MPGVHHFSGSEPVEDTVWECDVLAERIDVGLQKRSRLRLSSNSGANSVE